MENVQSNKMGTAPMFRLIISMSLPAMFSMLVQALYNVVDSYFVAQISEDALTAVSLVFPIQTLLIAVAAGTGIGINSLVSRRLGEQRQEAADSAASHGVVLALVSWVLFVLVGLFVTEPFFMLFTSDAGIAGMGADYMRIVCIASFGVFVEINLEKTLQATGNMIYPMVFQLVGAITNMILDPAFIFGFWFIPAMGVAGAAIATVIGQIFSMLVAIYVIAKKDHDVHISLRGFRVNWTTVKDIYAVGFPSIIMQSIGSVLVMGLNGILVTFSSTAVAVLGVYYKLQSFVFMPVFGLTHGVMPIMGYNFGARNKQRLLSALKIGCVVALVIMAFGTVLFWCAPDWLLSIFNASADMLSIGIPALRIISLCFIPAALGILFSTIFQAVGKGMYSLVISILRQLVVILPVAYFLAKLGLGYVWYAFPIAELVSFIASLVLYYVLYQKQIRTLEQPIEMME
ncbi:MAG TPA: MATE family efflux transporter [Candidatus Gallacutalibacter stercoravium]|nr:MATE family efflux transporter [Candidatus Gallacutalibacter stercoravium]